MHEFELRFAQIDLSENWNCANIYNNPRFNGWYVTSLDTNENGVHYIDTFIRFRMPSPIKIYGDVLRNFSQEERKAGIHRMMIGKDLQEDIKKILNASDSLSTALEKLSDEEVKEMLQRMERMITLDCNKVPYLHIRTLAESAKYNHDDVKNFILGLPDYLKIFYNVLNENITAIEAAEESKNIIYNELLTLKED